MEFFTVILEKSSRLVLLHNFVKMLDGHRQQNMKLRQAGNGLRKLWDVEPGDRAMPVVVEEYIPQPGLGLRRSKRIKMMKEKVKKQV
ncbi:hypothetical protein D1007_30206 [Hordeum vulgare]|nr:hypothetical protein D1007_30206 [Hordeum vulgare]